MKQYTCGDTLAGNISWVYYFIWLINPIISGPKGCLQYHTGTFGSFATFNWDLAVTTNAAQVAGVTHLANQDYDICFRREENYCRTCFSPRFAGSYGVSASAPTADESSSGDACAVATAGFQDYIEIPGAQISTASTTTSQYDLRDPAVLGASRMCGLVFNNIKDEAAAATICSKYRK